MKKKKENKTLVNTPFGTVRLARKDAQRFKKTVMQLQRTTDSLTRITQIANASTTSTAT